MTTAAEIIHARKDGMTIAEIAKATKLSTGTVCNVLRSYLNVDSA